MKKKGKALENPSTPGKTSCKAAKEPNSPKKKNRNRKKVSLKDLCLDDNDSSCGQEDNDAQCSICEGFYSTIVMEEHG